MSYYLLGVIYLSNLYQFNVIVCFFNDGQTWVNFLHKTLESEFFNFFFNDAYFDGILTIFRLLFPHNFILLVSWCLYEMLYTIIYCYPVPEYFFIGVKLLIRVKLIYCFRYLWLLYVSAHIYSNSTLIMLVKLIWEVTINWSGKGIDFQPKERGEWISIISFQIVFQVMIFQ